MRFNVIGNVIGMYNYLGIVKRQWAIHIIPYSYVNINLYNGKDYCNTNIILYLPNIKVKNL